MLFLIPVSYAQNTKGDKNQSQRIDKRENRVGLTKKKKTKNKNSYNRVQGRRSSQANRASKSPKVYSQKGPFVNNRSTTAKIKNARSRSQVNSRSVSGQQANKPRSQTNTRSVSGQQGKRNASSPRVRARSATGSTRNVYPQRGPYVNNPSRKPRSSQPSYSNRQQVARASGGSYRPDPPKRRRVTPRSASRSYTSKRSINAFAGFWNKKPKGEKAYEGDISGRPLRMKNFETKKPVLTNPTARPYQPKKRVGDRPYKGSAGHYVTATRSGKAWRGDVAGRKIRGRNFTSKSTMERAGQAVHPRKKSKQRVGDRPYKGTVPGGGYRSVSGKGGRGQGRLPGKAPGIGANGIDTYQGNIRGGKTFTPQGAGFSGNIKSRRPLKGGGSISGRAWNNNGQPVPGKSPGRGAIVGSYQGNIKGGKKSFSTQGADYSGNIKGGKKTFSTQGADYTGSIKAKKSKKKPAGAEQAAGFPGKHKLFDLKPGMRNQGEEFTGTMKARKPLKGGGSVSGKMWNNNEQHIAGKQPGSKIRMDLYQGNVKVNKKEPSKDVGGFPGKLHQFDLHPSMRDQGEEFTGHTRLPKFKKEYIQNPNSSKESLKKTRPDKTTYLVDGLQIKIKQQDYRKKPNAAENAMRGIGPGNGSIKASEYTKAMKQTWNYKHNPNAADEALDSHEPGKAFARSTDYQGNIKMRKVIFGKKGLHPDAQFVKTNKNNVDDERDVLTNFKLWWARLFKKSDTQPDHLKEKYKKPRYDKREQGLWYD